MSGLHRPPSRRRLIGLIVLLLIVAGGTVAYFYEPPPDTAAAGPGYWVSTHGSNTASGTAAHPWRTVAYAVATARSGSMIYVRGGTYRPFTIARTGLTVTSAPGERATIAGRAGTRDVVLIKASGVTVSHLTVIGCVPNKDPDTDVPGDEGSGIRVASTSGVTVTGVTVRDSHGTNAAGLPVGCYGILITGSRDVQVTSAEVYHNGAGIAVNGGGRGVVVADNNVHDQDVIVLNTPAAADDFGGYGLGAAFVTDRPGPVFRGNVVRRNYGPSTDYGVDGGGIELYDALNTTITGNTFAANNGVMETGTGSHGTCSGTVFSDNTATGDQDPSGLDSDTGLVLRCAAGMVIKGNTFVHLTDFTFLLTTGDDFGGSIAGLQIRDNTVTRRSGAVVYRLQYADGTPSVDIDANRYLAGQDSFAVMNGTMSETAVTFSVWRSRTGHDTSSSLL